MSTTTPDRTLDDVTVVDHDLSGAALAYANKIRKVFNLPALVDLSKGEPGDREHCVLAATIREGTTGIYTDVDWDTDGSVTVKVQQRSTTGHTKKVYSYTEIKPDVQEWLQGFDDGDFPEYIE